MRLSQWLIGPLIAFVVHSLLVLWIWIGVQTSNDGEAGMAWLLFERIDWPIAQLIFPASADNFRLGVSILTLGGFQWAAIGAVLQFFAKSIYGLRRVKDASKPRKLG